MQPNGDILFRETIVRKPWFVYPLVLLIAGAVWVVIIVEAAGYRLGDRPMPLGLMIFLGLVIGVGLPLFMVMVRQHNRVTRDLVTARLFPLWTFRIPIEQIASAEARRYQPIREYTGWGIRYTPWAGWAVNIAGKRGVQLALESGRKFLIGSDRAEELEAAIREAVSAHAPASGDSGIND